MPCETTGGSVRSHRGTARASQRSSLSVRRLGTDMCTQAWEIQSISSDLEKIGLTSAGTDQLRRPLSRALASMAVRERVAFEGYEWHTHVDLLVGTYGATEAEAIRNFVGEVLSDRLPIAVCSRDGSVHDIRISDDPAT